MAHIAPARLMDALEGGIAFLLEAQGPDGLWRDFETLAGEATDWPTAFIASQLVDAGVVGAPIVAAVAGLIRDQHRDGGWGYHRHVPSDADSTAWALLFLAAAGPSRRVTEQAGRCLLRHQDPHSGGVSTYAAPEPIRRYMGVDSHADVEGWCTHHLAVTATAGRAFAAVPRDLFANEASLAWRYVAGRQCEDGTWGSYWWVDRHFPTFQAVALARTRGANDAVARAATWVRSQPVIRAASETDRGAQSAFASALSLAILLRAGGHDDAVQQGLPILLSLQQGDGGWPAHAAMRIPPPHITEPDDYATWRLDELGTGVVVHDQHRLFTTAACVATLALAFGPAT